MTGPISLVGFMGSGKSTLGPRLAARLTVPFLDLDAQIVDAERRDIATIFDTDGEAAFRDIERQHLVRVLGDGPAVVATGGGAVEVEENRRDLRAAGPVLWLDVRLETVRARLRRPAGPVRPLLRSLDAAGLTALFRRRRELYASVADYRFECDHAAPTTLVRRMMLTLQEHRRDADHSGR